MNPILFYILAYAGFGLIATPLLGILGSWVDRKITARVQWRVGPPLAQPLYDLVKLMGKEIIIPRGCSRWTFLMAPVMGFSAAALVATLLWVTLIWPEKSFTGDLIVVLYFLLVPSIAVILGGFASRNPIASLGASREMKLMMADELPFLLAILVPVIMGGSVIRLGQFIIHQESYGMLFTTWAGGLALFVALMAVQAKLALVPFDIPEAETELMSGPYVEYSGPALAIYKLTHMMMLVILPMFLIVMFLGGIDLHGWGILWSICKLFVLLLLITLIRNTNPRVRIDQALKFFWGPMSIFGAAAVILALLGK